MSVTLRKPTHALAYLGQPHTVTASDTSVDVDTSSAQLEVRGVVVGRNATHVKISVTSVRGVGSKIDYSRHLAGTEIITPADRTILL